MITYQVFIGFRDLTEILRYGTSMKNIRCYLRIEA